MEWSILCFDMNYTTEYFSDALLIFRFQSFFFKMSVKPFKLFILPFGLVILFLFSVLKLNFSVCDIYMVSSSVPISLIYLSNIETFIAAKHGKNISDITCFLKITLSYWIRISFVAELEHVFPLINGLEHIFG